MTIKSNLQLLYPSMSASVIDLVIANAKDYILTYCNIPEYQDSLDTLVFKMSQEDINKLQAEGLQSEAAGGNSVQYVNDYTPAIMRLLNKHKKITIL